MCDLLPMDVYHIMLGRHWQYNRDAKHNGNQNTFSFKNDGKLHTLTASKYASYNLVLMLDNKDFFLRMKQDARNVNRLLR